MGLHAPQTTSGYSSLQYWPALTSHKQRPNSTNRVSRSRSEFFTQARISSILDSTNEARLGLSFGGTKALVHEQLPKVAKSELKLMG